MQVVKNPHDAILRNKIYYVKLSLEEAWIFNNGKLFTRSYGRPLGDNDFNFCSTLGYLFNKYGLLWCNEFSIYEFDTIDELMEFANKMMVVRKLCQ
jgi:hypothetical protein